MIKSTNSRINVQNKENYDRLELNYRPNLNNQVDISKIVCVKLPGADFFNETYLNSCKMEYKLTDILLKLNLVLGHSCDNDLFEIVELLECEIQNLARINGKWFDLMKYFQKTCFFSMSYDQMDYYRSESRNSSIKEQIRNDVLKLEKFENEINDLKQRLNEQIEINLKLEDELEIQSSKNIENLLNFELKRAHLEQKIVTLCDEYEKFKLTKNEYGTGDSIEEENGEFNRINLDIISKIKIKSIEIDKNIDLIKKGLIDLMYSKTYVRI